MNTTNTSSPEPEAAIPTPFQDFIAASVCFIVSILSLAMNGSVAVFTLRLNTMKTQFGYLCVSLAVADCGILAVFMFWTAPMTFSQNSEIATGFIGKKIGQFSLFFWFSCLYGTLAIAVNRLLAISYPVAYDVWFSTRNTMKVIALCWILAFCHITVFFFDECDVFYYPPIYTWMYAETNCGAWIAFLLDFIYGMVFFALIFILNVMAVFKLRKMNKVGVTSNTQQGQEEAERRRKQEIRFFVQACINAAIFEFLLISFHGFSRLATEKWGWFFTTTLMWQISHTSNGFLMFLFNPPLRRGMAIACCCLEKDMSVATNAGVGHAMGAGHRGVQATRRWKEAAEKRTAGSRHVSVAIDHHDELSPHAPIPVG